MTKFLAVFETTATGFAAYIPDLPGCVATGGTRDEVVVLINEGAQLHVAGMREDGTPVPEPTSTAEWIDIPEP
jgi:predicted RNase H-like HicB family nuclease